jgi:hypothetical protein
MIARLRRENGHAAPPLRKPFPKGLLAASQWRNGPYARNHNSSRGLRHALTNVAVSGRFSAIRSGSYRLPAAHLGSVRPVFQKRPRQGSPILTLQPDGVEAKMATRLASDYGRPCRTAWRLAREIVLARGEQARRLNSLPILTASDRFNGGDDNSHLTYIPQMPIRQKPCDWADRPADT